MNRSGAIKIQIFSTPVETSIVFAGLLAVMASAFANIFNPLNPFFFREELLILISLPVYIALSCTLLTRSTGKISFTAIDIILVAYVVYLLVNVMLRDATQAGSNEFLVYPVLITLYFLLRHFFSRMRDTVSFSRQYELFISAVASIPIIAAGLELTGIVPRFNNLFSMSGGMLNQGSLANYLAMLSPFLFSIVLLKEKKQKISIFSQIILACSVLIIVVTKARSAWLGVFFSFFYVLSYHPKIRYRMKKIKDRTTITILTVILTLFVLIPAGYFMYLFKKDSADGRIFMWKICLELVKDKSVTGHGFNHFITSFNNAQIRYFKESPNDTRSGMLARDGSFAYNDYLQLMIESGITGVVIYLFLLVLLIKRNDAGSSSGIDPLLTGSKAGILSMAVCSLFSYPMYIVQNLLLLFIYASFISSQSKSNCRIRLSSLWYYCFTAVMGLFLVLLLFYKIREYNACKKWKMAYLYSEQQNIREALNIYEEVYPLLKNRPLFLFNYGSQLSISGYSEKSVHVLQSCIAKQSSYDAYLNLAKSYEDLNNLLSAEKYYQKCSSLIPHRFVPKYRLFIIYKKTHRCREAREMANIIINMDIKVYSDLVGEIRNEAMKYSCTMNGSN